MNMEELRRKKQEKSSGVNMETLRQDSKQNYTGRDLFQLQEIFSQRARESMQLRPTPTVTAPTVTAPTVTVPTGKPDFSFSAADISGYTSRMSKLENELRQARIDLDTDRINAISAEMKALRAAAGKQTLGDRASDITSAIVSGVGSQPIQLAGQLVESVEGVDTYQRQINRLQEALKNGYTSDGKALTETQKEGIRKSITELEEKKKKAESGTATHDKIYAVADRVSDDSATFTESAASGLGTGGRAFVEASVSFGQSLAHNAIGAVTGTGMLPFVLGAYASASQEARRGGADLNEQIIYGIAQAGKEYVAEKLFGLAVPQKLSGSRGIKSFDDMIEKGIRDATTKLAKTKGGQRALGGFLTWLATGATEGIEEIFGAAVEEIAISPYLKSWAPEDERTLQEKINDAMYSGMVGGISGLLGVTNLLTYQPSEDATKTADVTKNKSGVSPATSPAASPEVQSIDARAQVTAAQNPGADVLDAAATLYTQLNPTLKPKNAMKKAEVVRKLVAGEKVEPLELNVLEIENPKARAVFTELTGVQFPEGATLEQIRALYRTAHTVAEQARQAQEAQVQAEIAVREQAQQVAAQQEQTVLFDGEALTKQQFVNKMRAETSDGENLSAEQLEALWQTAVELSQNGEDVYTVLTKAGDNEVLTLSNGATMTKEQFVQFMREEGIYPERSDTELGSLFDQLRERTKNSNDSMPYDERMDKYLKEETSDGRAEQTDRSESGRVDEESPEDAPRGLGTQNTRSEQPGQQSVKRTSEQENAEQQVNTTTFQTTPTKVHDSVEAVDAIPKRQYTRAMRNIRSQARRKGWKVVFCTNPIVDIRTGETGDGLTLFKEKTIIMQVSSNRGDYEGAFKHEWVHALKWSDPQFIEKLEKAVADRFGTTIEQLQNIVDLQIADSQYPSMYASDYAHLNDAKRRVAYREELYGDMNRGINDFAEWDTENFEAFRTAVQEAIREYETAQAGADVKAAKKQDRVVRENAEEVKNPERAWSYTTDQTWNEQLDELETSDTNSALYVRKTPSIYHHFGLGDLPMCMTKAHAMDDMHEESEENAHWHGVPESVMRRLPDLLERPAMVLKSNTVKGAIVVVTTATDAKNRPVVVAILPNGEAVVDGVAGPANFILSVYGRNNFSFTPGELNENNFMYLALRNRNILYWNRSLMEALAHHANLRLPFALREKVPSDRVLGTFEGYKPGATPERAFSKTPAAPMYSHMQRVIEAQKTNKFSANAVVPMLKGKGVKAEEIKWSGLDYWLEGKKTVTKQELLDFTERNAFVLEEEKNVGPSLEYEYEDNDTGLITSREDFEGTAWGRAMDMGLDENDMQFQEYNSELHAFAFDPPTRDYVEVASATRRRANGGTKWDQYTLDGGTNYTEILYRVPSDNYTNLAMGGHWGERKGVLVHARTHDFKTPEGKKVLFVEEIQSDWHNQGHAKGYLTEDVVRKKAEADRIRKLYYEQRTEEEKAKLAELMDELYPEQKRVLDQFNAQANRLEEGGDLHETVRKIADANFGGVESYAVNHLITEKRDPRIDHSLRSAGLTDDELNLLTDFHSKIREAQEELDEYEKQGGTQGEFKNRAPDAPYSKTYHEYVLKNMLRKAAEEGHDYVAWTTAAQQMARWNPDRKTNRELGIKVDPGKEDKVAFEEGYRIEYDQDIPSFMKKYVKAWGSGVEDVRIIGENGEDHGFVKGVPVTDTMKDDVLYVGQRMFSKTNGTAKKTPAAPMYSHMQRVVEGLKQDKFGLDTFMNTLRNKGVTEEELRWTGVRPFIKSLKDSGQKSITKQEALDFMRANEVVVSQEIYHGKGNEGRLYTDSETGELNTPEYFEAIWSIRAEEMGFDPEEDLRFRVHEDYLTAELWSEADGEFIDFASADRFGGAYDESTGGNTAWDRYTLQGGENYREILYKLPGAEYTNDAMELHWADHEGVLVHARVQDLKTPKGDRVLFVEELQSDWHNAGQGKGKAYLTSEQEALKKEADDIAYLGSDEVTTEQIARAKEINRMLYPHFTALTDARDKQHARLKAGGDLSPIVKKLAKHLGRDEEFAYNYYQMYGSDAMDEFSEVLTDEERALLDEYELENEAIRNGLREYVEKRMRNKEPGNRPPRAPFGNTYHEYVMKDLLRKAAEEGYDYIAWTTSKMQVDRWSKDYEKSYVNEYDIKIPSFMERHAQQWGAGVEDVHIVGEFKDHGIVKGVPITEQMADDVIYNGQRMFSKTSPEAEASASNAINTVFGEPKTEDYNFVTWTSAYLTLEQLYDEGQTNISFGEPPFLPSGTMELGYATDTEKWKPLKSYPKSPSGLRQMNHDLSELMEHEKNHTGPFEGLDYGSDKTHDIYADEDEFEDFDYMGIADDSTAYLDEDYEVQTYRQKRIDDAAAEREDFADTDTDAFRAWFNDDSGELTAEDGRPKVFFRGSPFAGATKFRSAGDATSGGIFFTVDPDVAIRYAQGASTGRKDTAMDSVKGLDNRMSATKEWRPFYFGSWHNARKYIQENFANSSGSKGLRLVGVDTKGNEVAPSRAKKFVLQSNIEGTKEESVSMMAKLLPSFVANPWRTLQTYPATQQGLELLNRELGDFVRAQEAGIRGYSKFYLTASKTLVVDAHKNSYLDIPNDELPDDVKKPGEYTQHINGLARRAWAAGYDCVVVHNVKDAGDLQTQYIVRDAGQVKSVYNTGTWDRSDPDFRYSKASGDQLGKFFADLEQEYGEGSADKMFQRFKQLDESRKAAAQMAKGVGAAAIDFSPYSYLQNTYGTHKPGEKPSHVVDVPVSTDGRNRVSQTIQTVMEAKATPEKRLETIEQAVVDNKFSYTAGINKIQANRAMAKIRAEGWAESLTKWTQAVRRGERTADLVAMGAVLLDNAGNSDMDGKRYVDLLVDYTDLLRSGGQVTQAARILKNLSPTGRLYGIQGYVRRMNENLRKVSPADNVPVEEWMQRTGEILARRLQSAVGGKKSQAKTTAQIILSDLNAFAKKAFPEKEKEKGAPRTEMERLQDLFDNYEQYKEAWDAAKDSIREAYMDKAEALAVFEKWLETDLADAFLGQFFKHPEVRISHDLAQQYVQAKTEEERDAVLENIMKNIAEQIPATFMEKFTALRYLNMLGNFRTQSRNLLSNAANLGLSSVKNKVAAFMETVAVASGANIERTKSFTRDKETYQWAYKDFDKMKDVVMAGGKYRDGVKYDERIEKHRQIFNTKKPVGKALEGYRKATNWAMTQGDIVFSRIAYADALAGYLAAHKATFDTADTALMEQARNYAVQQAAEATFRDNNVFSDAIVGMRFRNPDTWMKKGINMVADGLLPFRKTPANILVRSIEYSPLGVLVTAAEAVHGKKTTGKVDGSKVIDLLAKNLTGSALMALGFALANLGALRGDAGDDDKEKEFDELTGHQSYSIELPNGLSLTLDWMAPSSIPLFLGAQLAENAAEEGWSVRTVMDAIGSISDPMIQMSMLQGVNDALQNASTYGDDSALVRFTGNALWSYATQGLTNSLLGQIERGLKNERSTTFRDKNKDVPDGIQYLLGKTLEKVPIPGVDYGQIPYIDAWGRVEKNAQTSAGNWVNQLLNPAYASHVNESAMEDELRRLADATKDNSVLISRPKSYFNVDNERLDLTGEQYVEYATTRGQTAYGAATDLTESKIYGTLTEKQRVKAVNNVYDFANQLGKAQVTGYGAEKWDEEPPEGAAVPDKWVTRAARAAAEYGIPVGEYAALRAITSDIEGFKKENGESVDNSESLQVAVAIYDAGFNETQTKLLMEDFGVNQTVRRYSEAMTRRKLEAQKQQYGK